MSERYDRGTPQNGLYILVGAEGIWVPREDILSKLDVDTVVRVPECDYPHGSHIGDFIFHFGLPVYDMQVGQKVVMPAISENGTFTAESERPPLLSFDNVWIALITQMVEKASYDEVPSECFGNSIGGVLGVDELRQLILQRYSKVLSDQTKDQILSQGISIRCLQLIEKSKLT